MKRARASLAGIALAFGLALALGATPLAQNDRVVLKNGKDKQVRIKTEDLDGVWYTASGGAGNTVIRWSEIDSIQYGGAAGYDSALEALSAGRIADAAGQLETLAADAELRPVLRQSVLFHLGVANAQLGKSDAALARYAEVLSGFPKSRYTLPVGSSLLSLYLAKNDVTGAARALEPVLAAAKDAGSDAPLQAALGILRGRLLEAQKKFDEAVSVYEGTVRNAKAEPDMVAAAKLGMARCAHARGQANDAEQRYRELSKIDAPNAILAGAWNGLGDLALEQATAKRDSDGLRIALLSYLRGVVLYVPGQGEPSDELERALAGAARSAKAIGELEANAERKQVYLERSRQHRGQLASKYPGSRFLVGL
ncbi:MAG: tetratricopeptide repeat protein [Planctomycetes bacterium]|nr:tetratricopeptide repeat protein [Planctomycetota bacterium]